MTRNLPIGAVRPIVVETILAALIVAAPAARLAAGSPPAIQPSASFQHQSVALGENISFTVTATGDLPRAYQWRLEGVDLAGRTNPILSIANAQPGDEGDYTVLVTNAFGSLTSAPARLYVVPPAIEMLKSNYVDEWGLRLPYFFHLPEAYDPSNRYPLVMIMHGRGGDETTTPPFFAGYSWTRVFASYQQQATDPAILVWPSRRAGDTYLWTTEYLQLVSALLDRLITDYSIATNRIYVGGASEGLHAAWDLAGMRPSFFAGLFIGAGWAGSTTPGLLKNLPIWVACAANDEGGQLGNTRAAVESLRAAGGCPIYMEYNAGGHMDGIGMFARTPVFVDWVLAQRQGSSLAGEPLLCVTNPIPAIPITTGASAVSLSGWAAAPAAPVTRVIWTNATARRTGLASGTNAWNATNIPLLANRTNLILVIGTTTSWSAGYGGTTTFNDIVSVVSCPLRVHLSLEPGSAVLTWAGGAPPFNVERTSNLGTPDWQIIQTNVVSPVSIPLDSGSTFYRISGR